MMHSLFERSWCLVVPEFEIKQKNKLSLITESKWKTPKIRTRDRQKKISSAVGHANHYASGPGRCAENSFRFKLLRFALTKSTEFSKTIFEWFNSETFWSPTKGRDKTNLHVSNLDQLKQSRNKKTKINSWSGSARCAGVMVGVRDCRWNFLLSVRGSNPGGFRIVFIDERNYLFRFFTKLRDN